MEKLIPVEDLLKFTKKKSQYAWRWDHSFNLKDKATIYINYGYNENELPDELVLTFKYIDTEKSILKNQNIESNVVHKIKVPKPQSIGKSLLPFGFDIKTGNKILWKIFIEAQTKKEVSYTYFSFGE
jgi:hypothetical protein